LESPGRRRSVVTPSTGGVVLVPFPFSDLSQAKLRPAAVLAEVGRGDWVLCQVTSNAYGDPRAILLTEGSFASGSLRTNSYARPGKLFTASADLIVSQVGVLRPEAHELIVEAVVSVLRGRGAA
jgi:mRNA interferase MazF